MRARGEERFEAEEMLEVVAEVLDAVVLVEPVLEVVVADAKFC